jgi:hypothetical protein
MSRKAKFEKRSSQNDEAKQMMKDYRDELDDYWDNESSDNSYHSDKDNNGDNFNILINYFVPRESSVRLFNQISLDNLNDPTSSDRNLVAVKDVGIYTKGINAIRNLPKSPERNLVLSDYQRTVDKYVNQMKRILENWDESEYSPELLENNVHIRNFRNENKITFKFYSVIHWTIFHVQSVIFHLNNDFKLNGAKFEELPIKYVISSTVLKLYAIWFDDSLAFRLRIQWNRFLQRKKHHEQKFNLNCLPFSVLSDPFINNVWKMFFNDFVINTATMEIEIRETSKNYEKLKKLWSKLNELLKGKFNLRWIK